MSAIREKLRSPYLREEAGGRKANAGLWLDRFYGAPEDEPGPAKAEHFEIASKIRCPEGYAVARERRATLLVGDEGASHAEVRDFKSHSGRCVVGIGESAALENGITLNRVWGVPMIPGSALKGITATAANRLLESDEWRPGGASYDTLFGTTKQKGIVTFHDAWAILQDGESNGLAPDVMTNHYAGYYQPKDAHPESPNGTESPNPVPFITSTCDFEVILEVDRKLAGDSAEEWLGVAWEILTLALEELGVGAKTNAGYGRFYLDKTSVPVGELVAEVEQSIKAKTEGAITKRQLFEKWAETRRAELLDLPAPDRERVAQLLWKEFKGDSRFKEELPKLDEELRGK